METGAQAIAVQAGKRYRLNFSIPSNAVLSYLATRQIKEDLADRHLRVVSSGTYTAVAETTSAGYVLEKRLNVIVELDPSPVVMGAAVPVVAIGVIAAAIVGALAMFGIAAHLRGMTEVVVTEAKTAVTLTAAAGVITAIALAIKYWKGG